MSDVIIFLALCVLSLVPWAIAVVGTRHITPLEVKDERDLSPEQLVKVAMWRHEDWEHS
jgi:hypothetical protein